MSNDNGNRRRRPAHPGCDKVRFPTRKKAVSIAQSMRDNGRGPLGVYACRACDGFHLTHLEGDK